MAYLMLDGLITVDPPEWLSVTMGNSIMEPFKDPKTMGLYIAPFGVGSAMVPQADVVTSGNYSVIGLPRRKRSRG